MINVRDPKLQWPSPQAGTLSASDSTGPIVSTIVDTGPTPVDQTPHLNGTGYFNSRSTLLLISICFIQISNLEQPRRRIIIIIIIIDINEQDYAHTPTTSFRSSHATRSIVLFTVVLVRLQRTNNATLSQVHAKLISLYVKAITLGGNV